MVFDFLLVSIPFPNHHWRQHRKAHRDNRQEPKGRQEGKSSLRGGGDRVSVRVGMLGVWISAWRGAHRNPSMMLIIGMKRAKATVPTMPISTRVMAGSKMVKIFLTRRGISRL